MKVPKHASKCTFGMKAYRFSATKLQLCFVNCYIMIIFVLKMCEFNIYEETGKQVRQKSYSTFT